MYLAYTISYDPQGGERRFTESAGLPVIRGFWTLLLDKLLESGLSGRDFCNVKERKIVEIDRRPGKQEKLLLRNPFMLYIY